MAGSITVCNIQVSHFLSKCLSQCFLELPGLGSHCQEPPEEDSPSPCSTPSSQQASLQAPTVRDPPAQVLGSHSTGPLALLTAWQDFLPPALMVPMVHPIQEPGNQGGMIYWDLSFSNTPLKPKWVGQLVMASWCVHILFLPLTAGGQKESQGFHLIRATAFSSLLSTGPTALPSILPNLTHWHSRILHPLSQKCLHLLASNQRCTAPQMWVYSLLKRGNSGTLKGAHAVITKSDSLFTHPVNILGVPSICQALYWAWGHSSEQNLCTYDSV